MEGKEKIMSELYDFSQTEELSSEEEQEPGRFSGDYEPEFQEEEAGPEESAAQPQAEGAGEDLERCEEEPTGPEGEENPAEGAAGEGTIPRNYYRDSTYTIVSLVSYLLGVPKRIFENEHEPPRMEFYKKLELDKNARIVRNLCVLRTAIERNFGQINDQMTHNYRSLATLTDLVPQDCIMQLADDGIHIIKSGKQKLNQYIIDINRTLSDRINNCKDLFPMWVDWKYIRDIFIMPNGLTESGIKAAADLYYSHKSNYPYQVYMNWPPSNEGNILYNDKKFVTLLYRWHDDEFIDISKVSNVGTLTKGNIYDFLDDSMNAVLVVDCENSDPYKLCAVLNNLDADNLEKISKIMLYDDPHTAVAWRILENFTSIPVEHIMNERVKQNKSLVDISLTAGVCREFYQNQVDSFVLLSSDSDYWGLISALPAAQFLVMVERDKCGPDIKAALSNSGIFYCFIDDFYSGDSGDIKLMALTQEIYRYLDQRVRLNVNDMLTEAFRATRIEMSEAERQQFYQKYIRPMSIVIQPDGQVKFQLQGK